MTRVFISLILTLWAGLAYADQTSIVIPETNAAFNTQFGTTGNVTFGPAAHYAINPALKTIAGNSSGTNCTGIASPVPYQWCVDTTAKTVKLYTPNVSSVYSFNPALTINADGSLSPVLANPTFTGNATASDAFGGFLGNFIFLQQANNGVFLYRGAAATDMKEWQIGSDTTKLHFSLNNDAEVAILDWLSVTRVDVTSATSFFNSMVGIGIDSTVVADSTTDVGALINAALNKYGYVKLPQPFGTAFYRSSVTITIPGGATLEGTGTDSCTTCSGAISPGTEIRCDAGVSPCIKIGQGVAGGAAARLSNIKQSRAGAQPAAGAALIGIQFSGGVDSKADHVTANNNSICMLWRTPPGTGTGISAILDTVQAYNCSDVYWWQDGWPEIRVTNGRLGETNESPSNTYIRISCTQHNCSGAGAPNGLFVSNVQFNSSSATPVVDFMQLTDLGTHVEPAGGADAQLPTFDNVHAENFTNFLRSDSSWDVALGMMCTASSFFVNGGATFALDTHTSVSNWNLTGCNFLDSGGGATFNLNPSGNSIYSPFAKRYVKELQIVGGIIGMAGTVTGQGNTNSMASIMGVSHRANFTLDGRWANLSVIGGNWTGGNLTDSTNASDDVNIIENNIYKFHGNVGVTCGAGISGVTGRTYLGLITAC